MRKTLAAVALVAALTLPGIPAAAHGDTGPATCPVVHTGAAFGTHIANMARDGHLGVGMNPGMHRGFSGMAH